MNRKLVALSATAITALLVAVGVGAAFVFPTPTAAVEAPADEEFRLLHLRIYDQAGTMLLSSWPDENGSLVTEYERYGAAEPDGILDAPWADWPPVFQGIVPLLRNAPAHSTLSVGNVTLAASKESGIEVERTLTLARENTIPRADADRIFGAALVEDRATMFQGAIPIKIIRVNEKIVHYRILVEDKMTINVPATDGLELAVEPQPGDALRFTLEAPTGFFYVWGGCNLIHTTLNDGLYRIDDPTASGNWSLTRYASGLDFALEDITVNLEVLYLD